MRGTRPILLALALGCASAPSARAQAAAGQRVYVTANAAFDMTEARFTSLAQPIDFAEPALVRTSNEVSTGAGLGLGGGVRIWNRLAVGVEIARFSRGSRAGVTAQIPHPFQFGRMRPVSGDASDRDRTETIVDLRAVYLVELGRKWELALAGGPSWVQARGDFVRDVTVTQTYPFDTATFSSVVTDRRTASGIGFNAGGDLQYLFARHAGVGAGLGYTHARLAFGSTADLEAVTINGGGAHVSGGLRLWF